MSQSSLTAKRHSRRVKIGGSFAIAFFFALLAIAFAVIGLFGSFFIFWPLAALCFLGAFVTDSKKRTVHFCGECGNEVAPTSRLCPTCHSAFFSEGSPITRADQVKATVLLVLVAAPVLAFLFWFMNRS